MTSDRRTTTAGKSAVRHQASNALSVAIPYTDAVVTDADVWDVTTHRARLDAEFGTPIFKSLTELVTHLGL